MGYRVGVDIGGSFTDFAVFDEDNGEIKSLKVFSRPDQPGEEVIAGVRMLGERYGIQPEQITYFTHGTTVGINTVIQRKGLKLALFTTENFSDVLELARLKTPDMYHLLSRRPAPLVKRSMVFGIAERMGPDGTVRAPLDEASVERAVRQALDAGAEGIVVSLLHAYRNPAHELRVREIAEALAPGLPVSCSSETWPIIREYERTITAVIGGYVQPRVAHYLTSLQQALKNAGVQPEPRLTKSNGGVMTAEQGKRDCVQMILSGTAAGVIGASHVAATAGLPRCLSLDIGGTSADIAVIVDGKPQYGVGELIGDFQIYIPSVSVSSVGEGGGSIAWVDPLGVLKVGPESAGSHPAPPAIGAAARAPPLPTPSSAAGWSAIPNWATRPSRSMPTPRARRWASWPTGWAAASRKRPRPSSRSPSPACIRRSAAWCRATASIRASMPCWPSAAPARCWAASWRASSRSARSWCRPRPAPSARWAA